MDSQIGDPRTDQIKKDEENGNVSFEQALTLTGFGRYNYIVFFITIFSLLAAAAEMFGVGMLVTLAQCDLDLDVYRMGIISSVPMLGVIVTAHLWGYIADTKGRKYALTITMLGTTLVSIISSFANHWTFLAFTKFLSAAFASGTNAVIYAMLGEVTPEANRPKLLLYSATSVMLSLTINCAMAYPVLNLDFSIYIPFFGLYRPWRLLATIFGLLSLVNYIFLEFLAMESPKYYFAKGDDENGMEILRKVYTKNTGKSSETYPVKKVLLKEKVVKSSEESMIVLMINRTVPLFHKENIKNTFLVSYISIVSYGFCSAFSVWMPTIFSVYSKDLNTDKNFCYILQKGHVVDINDNITISELPYEECDDSLSVFAILALVSFSLYMTIITALSVVFIRYTGKRWMFIGIHIFSICLSLTVNLVYNIGGIVMFVVMLSAGLGIGIATTYAVELFPTYLRAMALCLTMMVGRAASFISINLIGPQLETNCNNFMYIIAVFLLSGIIVALFLPDDDEKLKKEDTEPENTP